MEHCFSLIFTYLELNDILNTALIFKVKIPTYIINNARYNWAKKTLEYIPSFTTLPPLISNGRCIRYDCNTRKALCIFRGLNGHTVMSNYCTYHARSMTNIPYDIMY